MIKIFNNYNEDVINDFLIRSKGTIKNYNPIVIEYELKNLKDDPYKNLTLYHFPKAYNRVFELANFDKEYNLSNELKLSFDVIGVNKRTNELSIFKGEKGSLKLLYTRKMNTIGVSVDTKKYLRVSVYNNSSIGSAGFDIQYGFGKFADVLYVDANGCDFETEVLKSNGEKLN